MSAKALDLNLGAGPDRSTAALILLGGLVGCLSALLAVMLGPAALGVPVLAVIALMLVRHPLVLFVVFGHIGLFKQEPVIEALPFDATVALGILLLAVCLQRVLSRRATAPPFMFLVPLLVIAILMAISLNWTPVPDYGLSKTLRFVTLTSIGAFAPFCLLESRDDLIRLLKVFAGCALVAGLLVGAFGSTAAENRLEFGGAANTIFTSRFLLSGALVLILGAMLKVFPRHRVPLALLGLVLVGLAAGIGSRGPIVGLVLAMVCTLAAVVLRQPARVLPVLAIVAAGIALFPFISLPETSAERLQGLAENPVGTLNEDLRSRLYGKAIELTQDYPQRGIGTGGFFLYSYVLTNREERYPHNVFLEASSELGLFPAVLLAASVLLMLIGLYRRAWGASTEADRNLVYVIGGLFLLNFFAAQFSGDFNDNRTFWALLGVGWWVAVRGVPEPQAGRPETR
jgi:O-antigen ligase